jgi:hypothetical protein
MQQVPWLPEFLKDSRPARAGLEVLLPPQVAKKGPNQDQYLEAWKDKVRELLARTLKETRTPKYVHQEIYGILLSLGSQVADQYLVGDEAQDDLLEALRLHPEAGGLEELLAYLRDPSQENKEDLLSHYPQGQPLEPQEPEVSLAEFLLSL